MYDVVINSTDDLEAIVRLIRQRLKAGRVPLRIKVTEERSPTKNERRERAGLRKILE